MTAGNWKEIERLYLASLRLPSGERAQFLAESCANDEMRRQIESLLAQRENLPSFLERRALDVAAEMVVGSVSPVEAPVTGAPAMRSGIGEMRHVYEKSRQKAHWRNVPWWIWIGAASFLFHFGVFVYLDFAGPNLGLQAVTRNLVVARVYSDSPAEAAGFQVGDRIVRARGQSLVSQEDWFVILANLRVGEPASFEVLRGERRLSLTATPSIRSFTMAEPVFGSWEPVMLATLRMGQLFMLGLACFVAFARPRSGTALLGASFLAVLSVLDPPQAYIGFSAVIRALPMGGPLHALHAIPSIGRFVSGALLLTFCATFPRRLIRARWIWTLLWIPPLIWLPPVLFFAYRVTWVPDRAIGLFPEWASGAVSLTLFAYFAASAVVMAVNYRRLNDVNERRRVRVLVAGFIAAVLASLPLFLAFAMPFLPRNSIRDPLLSVPVLALLMLVAIVGLPLSFAYSILRHRLFDVRIIIRQGVQYALARGVLLSVLPLLAVFLVGDLLIRDNQSLAATLKERGWIYFFLGIVTGIVYRKRQQWLNQIDRRFFRDRFDANCLLQEVIQDVKQAANLDAVSDTVLTRIQEALHPEFVSLVHHEGGERQFRSIASLPPLDAAALQVEGKLMGLVRVVGKPIQLSDSAWLADALPLNEAHLIDGRRIELVVPIQLSSDGAESLLVFGPKQSEEPYSREDQKLLSAIAASLASLSIKGENREPHTKSFGECPDCGACFNATEAHCHRDGSDLVRVYMTRLLSKRYRLEQRIGRGGMGTVYSGIDQELERPVAVKLIRPELLRNPDMIARFRKEARAAAGVVHRNVVTIYDFGVEEERPFIVMELLAGRTLRAELAAGKPLTPDRTLEILDGVCSAIKDAHLRQLLHRDLKPSNIFLAQTATGEVVKILDFGLVKVLAKSTLSTPGGASVIAGTPYYMAPELLMGEAASTASEMWALGVIAYEMLTGAHPFVTNTATAWQKDVLIGRFTPVHIHQLNVSPHLQAFFEQVFQLDPSRRIGSAQVFRSELECALKVPYTAGRQSNLAE